MIRKRRMRVRMHLANGEPSIEGVLVGRAAGHYQLAVPSVLETATDVHPLHPEVVAWIPRERVVFFESLPGGSS